MGEDRKRRLGLERGIWNQRFRGGGGSGSHRIVTYGLGSLTKVDVELEVTGVGSIWTTVTSRYMNNEIAGRVNQVSRVLMSLGKEGVCPGGQ